MTPRARRKTLEEGASAHRRKLARETTPEPALRKMKDKVQKLKAKAAKGQLSALSPERWSARAATGQAGSSGHSIPESGEGADAKHPALQRLRNSLSKTSSLGAATAAVDFLRNMLLYYCTNCEDE